MRNPLAQSYGPTAILTPANALTVVRLLLTPVVLALMLELRHDWPTFAMWTVLCLTDGADGFLARRQGVTRSGAYLDPLADKFLSLGGMGVLAAKHVFWWPVVALIAVREVALTWYRSALSRRGVSLPARRSAKFKTAFQQSAVGFTLMPWVGVHASWVGKTVLLAAFALTVWSGLLYLADARKADTPGRW